MGENDRGSKRYHQQRRELEAANRNKLINGDKVHRMTHKVKPVKLLLDNDWLRAQEHNSSILPTKYERGRVNDRSSGGNYSSSSSGRGKRVNGNMQTANGNVVKSVSRNVGDRRSYSPPRSSSHGYRTSGSIDNEGARDGSCFYDSLHDDGNSVAGSLNFDTISSVRQRFKRGGTRWWKIMYEPKFKPSLRPANLEFSGSLSRSSKRAPHQPLWKLERISNVHMPHFTQAFSNNDKFPQT